MAFESFAAFIAMDGHGPYVWACYGAFFVLMGAVMLWSVQRRKAAMDACRRDCLTQQGEGAAPASRTSATFARVNVSQD